MRPYLLASTLLVIGSLMLAHFILPASNQRKLDFEVEYSTRSSTSPSSICTASRPGHNRGSINAGRQVGLVLEQWEGDRLREKWMASMSAGSRRNRHGGSQPSQALVGRGWQHFEKVAVLDGAGDEH